jgi:hypothetical protein
MSVDRAYVTVLSYPRDLSAHQRMIEAPQAIFDDGFGKFRPPPNASAHSSRAFGDASVTIVDSGPAFDFYSVWKCLLLIHLRKRGSVN